MMRLADSLPQSQDSEPRHVDTLVAALLAIGEEGGEQEILSGDSGHRRRVIAGLSDMFLAGLPKDKDGAGGDEPS